MQACGISSQLAGVPYSNMRLCHTQRTCWRPESRTRCSGPASRGNCEFPDGDTMRGAQVEAVGLTPGSGLRPSSHFSYLQCFLGEGHSLHLCHVFQQMLMLDSPVDGEGMASASEPIKYVRLFIF
eukprot:213604-Chlamydomonas_euryale.AAC.30